MRRLRSTPAIARRPRAAPGRLRRRPAGSRVGRARARPDGRWRGRRTGGTVRIGIAGYPDSLNPGLAVLSESYDALSSSSTTRRSRSTSEGEYVPELATEWSARDDGADLDGDAARRRDVPRRRAARRPRTSSSRSSSTATTGLPVPDRPTRTPSRRSTRRRDDHELTTVTDEPVGNFEYRMSIHLRPAEAHLGSEEPADFENEEMIGSGPFKFVEARQDESSSSPAIDDYWGTVPAIDGVIFQTIDNADARVTALTTRRHRRSSTSSRRRRSRRCGTPRTWSGQHRRRRGRRQPARHHSSTSSTETNCPPRRRRLHRPPRAQGPRGSAGARPCHRQGADHPGRDARHGDRRASRSCRRPRRLPASELEDYAFDIDEAEPPARRRRIRGRR